MNIYAKCSYFASQCFLLVSSVRALDAVESLLNAFACQTEPHMPSRVVFRRSFGTTQVVSTIFRVCLFWSFWKMPYVKVTVGINNPYCETLVPLCVNLSLKHAFTMTCLFCRVSLSWFKVFSIVHKFYEISIVLCICRDDIHYRAMSLRLQLNSRTWFYTEVKF